MTSRKIELDDKTEWRNKEGRLHRLDGPAREYHSRTSKEWWINGELHRVEGPAIDWLNGFKEWWYKGVFFSSKEAWFNALTKEDQITYLFDME